MKISFRNCRNKYVILIYILGLCCIQLQAKTVFLSPLGNDQNDGLTTQKPKKTPQNAFDLIEPGDTLVFLAGEYSDIKQEAILKITKSGSSEKWITIKNYKKDKATLYSYKTAAILLQGASFVQIIGLDITRDPKTQKLIDQSSSPSAVATKGYGIYSEKSNDEIISSNIKIQNCKIYNCMGSGIYLTDIHHFEIKKNEIYNNGYFNFNSNSGIKLTITNSAESSEDYQNFIIGNRIYFNRKVEVLQKEEDCEVNGFGAGINIRKSDHIESHINPSKVKNKTLVINNLVYSNGGNGINLYNIKNVDVVNNTLYENNETNHHYCAEIHLKYASFCAVYNNIIYARETRKASYYKDASELYFKTNLYRPGTKFENGQGDIVADPKFYSVESYSNIWNFGLQIESPAIDRGTNLELQNEDFLGNSRKTGKFIDIGAIEFQKPIVKKDIKLENQFISWNMNYDNNKKIYHISNLNKVAFYYTIYDLMSRPVKKRSYKDYNELFALEIPIEDLPRGYYFIKVYTDKTYLITKFYKPD